MAVRRQALRLAARAMEQKLNADTSRDAGPKLAGSCGGILVRDDEGCCN